MRPTPYEWYDPTGPVDDWHFWFAWRPVITDSRRLRWLCKLHRRRYMEWDSSLAPNATHRVAHYETTTDLIRRCL